MSHIRLFRIRGRGGAITHVATHPIAIEKSLQTLIERNLFDLLGVRFLASEYATGHIHGGRIDTLAIDRRGAPVVVEYKRTRAANLVNQGLFYLDWLLDHRGEYRLLVAEKLGAATASAISWGGPRLICVAASFSRYDCRAIQQIKRNIELVRYRWFDGGLLLLEPVDGRLDDRSARGERRHRP